MKILDLCKQKQENISGCKPITIAFLGDSVTQGCFECYLTGPDSLETVFDYKSAYSTRVKEILNMLYPNVQINIINSGISGDRAVCGAQRLERDVISYNPDLVVVSYGLNDSSYGGLEKMDEYINSLEDIFARVKKSGAEIIFLTQNYMNTKTSPHLRNKLFIDLAEHFAGDVQNSGILKKYFEAARLCCEKHGVAVCDLYPVWERLCESGVDITELLANKLNHPIREFHYYMAMKLVETMLFS